MSQALAQTRSVDLAQAPQVRTDLYGLIPALYYAYRDSPLLREALDVIADKARHEVEAHDAKARTCRPGTYDLDLARLMAGRYREVRQCAISLMDHLDGHEGFDDARDALEAALEVL